MKTAKKVRGTAVSMPVGIAIGTCVSILITSVLAGVLTWLVLSGRTGDQLIGYISMGIILVASVSGSLLAAIKIKRRRMLVCCVTGAVYYASMLVSTAVFFGGNYRGIGVTGLLILVGSIISGMMDLTWSSGTMRKFNKYHNS